MKRILILILVFMLTASLPCVSYAMDIEEETVAGNVVDSELNYGPLILSVYNDSWQIISNNNYNVGDNFNLTLPVTDRIIYQVDLNILSYLTEEQKYLLSSSVSTVVILNTSVDFYSDPSFDSIDFVPRFMSTIGNESQKIIRFDLTNALPVDGTYEVDYSNYFYGSDLKQFTFQMYCYFKRENERLYDMEFSVPKLNVTIRTVGADKSTADIVINLGNVNNSINQGFDNLGNQIGDVQEDINSGFNEVGGKLDSMLTPDSNNQQAVDQMGGQVNNNKQEAEDIKNQIDSLDKPDPDDLIDQIDPDQFIDNDDEAVQEMTGILASVTGSKVVKNYLLLLICVGIVSFVVYGKKGG